jgi:predicted SAM-dependent methyltransferase
MKLNLGCRNNILERYVNVDFDELHFRVENPVQTKEEQDTLFLCADIMDIDLYFKAGTIEEIVANHFFEHLTHEQITKLLYKLWCLLMPGGMLKITTPDFYQLLCSYKEKHEKGDFSDVDILHIKVFDTEEESFHKTVWYYEIGKYYLEREGFFKVEDTTKPSRIEISFVAYKIE